jgi:putative adhesin
MKRPLRTLLIVFGAVIAVGGILMAAWTGIVVLSSHDVRAEKSFRISSNDLIIDTDNGGVTIESGEAGVIEVKRKITDSISGPDPTWSLEGNRLKLRLHCSALFGIACKGSYAVKVPLGLPLTVSTDNGAIEASGLKQNMKFSTDNGHVEVSDSVGDLDIRTDNGGVDVTRTTANNVKATTDNGGVRLRFDNSPTTVQARTDNGGVRITVPNDGTRYKLDIKTDNGGRDIDVPNDPTANHTISAHTDNGGISIQPTAR